SAARQHVDHAAVDGFAGQHEHAPAAFFDLQEQIPGGPVAPDVGAAGGALRDAPRDLDGRAPRQALHVHQIVVADALGRGHGDLQVADLAQHEQAVIRLFTQRLDPEDDVVVDGAGQHEILAAQVIGDRAFDDVVAAGEADDVLGVDSHGGLVSC